MFRLCCVAMFVVAVHGCGEPCANNGQCSGACARCSPAGVCAEGLDCGALCVVNTDCGSNCSVCSPVGANFTFQCVAGCNQKCVVQGDCHGDDNFGCGNCVRGQCVKGKACRTPCMADDECGTYDNRDCNKCMSGKCAAGCGARCSGPFANACGDPHCPSCLNNTCSVPNPCGGACVLSADCGASCPTCTAGKCSK